VRKFLSFIRAMKMGAHVEHQTSRGRSERGPH
jgi:hypothetical protein